MAEFTACPYTPDHLADVLALLSAWRLAQPETRLAVYPTPHRLTLLLSSRLHMVDDARICRRDGQVVGFAFLWSRRASDPWRGLEGPFTAPALGADERVALRDEIIAWGKGRIREINAQPGASGGASALICGVSEGDVARQADLARWGFACGAERGNVYFGRALAEGDPQLLPSMPEGYDARPVKAADLDAYEALYSFAPVDRAARLALLRDPEYAHLVVVAPDGAFVAFCEVSFSAAEWAPGMPRPGWIDYVGTREDAVRHGYGRAALLAGLAHLRRMGANRALLVTIPTNEPANALYAATGFTRTGYEDVYAWRPRAR